MRRSSRLLIVILGALLILAFTASVAAASESCWTPRSPGFWKNHPEAWPSNSITIGGVTYTKAQAIALLGEQGGDKSITLFRQAVAAKLNVMSGSHEPWFLDSAEEWLSDNPAGSLVDGSSSEWQDGGECLYNLLVSYNGG